MKLKLPRAKASAGKTLQWAKEVTNSVICKGPTVYKIGLTGNPLFRFYKKPSQASPSTGYFHDREQFQYMYVVFAGATWDEAALMEAALIAEFAAKPGNRNINPGGEGRPVYEPPYFTYVVFKCLEVAKRRRQ